MADKSDIKYITDQRPFYMVQHDIIESELFEDPYEMLVYLVLLHFASKNDNTCFPSHATLARICKISKTTVKKTLSSLRAKGIIDWEPQKSPTGGKSSNIYSIYNTREMWVSNDRDEIEQSKAKASCNVSDPELGENKKYSEEELKELYSYDQIIAENPTMADQIDAVIDLIFENVNSDKPCTRIGKEMIPTTKVKKRLLSLTGRHIVYAIQKMNKSTGIINTRAYILTLLYHTNHDMTLDNGNAKIGTEVKAGEMYRNQFTDFPQRNYDFDTLEKCLIENY